MGRNPRRLALLLVGASLAWNLVEAGVALAAGAEAGSIALFGFGLDSVLEAVASGVVLWRFGSGDADAGAEAQERAVLRVVGATFLLLAAYVTIQSVRDLAGGQAPEESVVGIVLAGLSLVVMPSLAVAKLRLASRIGSRALAAEAKETIACAGLSLALLLGLLGNALASWWWADPLAALAMVPWLLREGWEGLRGETCCDED